MKDRDKTKRQLIDKLVDLRQRAEKYTSLVNVASDIVFSIDIKGNILFANAVAQAFTGYAVEQALGRNFAEYVHPDDVPALRASIQQALDGEPLENIAGIGREVEYRLVKRDGQVIWVATKVQLTRDAQGKIVGFNGSIRDITERAQAEEQIKAALAEREVLLREVHHRVKNNLQALIHLIDMQAETMADRELIPAFEDLQGRIRAMAMIHEKLYHSKDLALVDLGEFLDDLMARLYHVVGVARPIALRVRAADEHHPEGLCINVNVAIPCGLIVNELVTNALKHAFPAPPLSPPPAGDPSRVAQQRWDGTTEGQGGPEIWVEFRSKEGECVLVVGDNGVGLPPDLDWRTTGSLGLKLVNLWATYQLGGSLQVDARRGTVFSVRFAV